MSQPIPLPWPFPVWDGEKFVCPPIPKERKPKPTYPEGEEAPY
jgi:hypothetical protein